MTYIRRTALPGFAICLAGFAGSLFADSLSLRNGTVVEGNYLGGTAREIRMEVGDRVQTYPVDSVAGIQFGFAKGQISSNQPDDRGNSRSRLDSPGGNNFPTSSGPVLPAGTQVTVRLIDSIDSEGSRLGDVYHASIDEPVVVDGQTVIPRGADVSARLVEDQKSGKIQGRTVLKLILTSVNVNGRQVDISTQDLIRESGSRGARSAKVIGGTAALGAIVGGIAGGGKGAAIGAGSGAALGTGVQELGHGQRVKIPSETRLVFTLSSSVRL